MQSRITGIEPIQICTECGKEMGWLLLEPGQTAHKRCPKTEENRIKCMYCGMYHWDEGPEKSRTLYRHITAYYRAGGTIPLNEWEK